MVKIAQNSKNSQNSQRNIKIIGRQPGTVNDSSIFHNLCPTPANSHSCLPFLLPTLLSFPLMRNQKNSLPGTFISSRCNKINWYFIINQTVFERLLNNNMKIIEIEYVLSIIWSICNGNLR